MSVKRDTILRTIDGIPKQPRKKVVRSKEIAEALGADHEFVTSQLAMMVEAGWLFGQETMDGNWYIGLTDRAIVLLDDPEFLSEISGHGVSAGRDISESVVITGDDNVVNIEG